MRYSIIGLALLLLGSGCASYEPTYAPTPIVPAADWHVKNGLAAAVYPIVEEEQQQKLLNGNLNEADVMAFQVIVENRTERMMVVRPLDMVLTLPDQRTLGPTSAASVAHKVEENGSIVGSAVAFGLIGALVAISAEDDAKKARVADYEAKSLKWKRLAKNQSTHGFVFFIPPPGSGVFDEATLSVFFIDEKAATTEMIEVPVTQLGFKPKPVRVKENPQYPE